MNDVISYCVPPEPVRVRERAPAPSIVMSLSEYIDGTLLLAMSSSIAAGMSGGSRIDGVGDRSPSSPARDGARTVGVDSEAAVVVLAWPHGGSGNLLSENSLGVPECWPDVAESRP